MSSQPKPQRGGFILGMIVGVLVGLALALAVAVYVTKVPLPFIDKVPQRTAEDDAAEAERNKNWDPNSPLYGKNPAVPRDVPAQPVESSVVTAPTEAAPAAASAASAPARSASAPAAATPRDPAAILSGQPVSTAPTPDALNFQVQAGAYGSQAEAEQQKAKLAMMGLEARLQAREVNGRTMYRVRLGPYADREQADAVRVKLQDAGIESALVRVQP
ncbi:MAG: SPOR domain-containing protein [Aquabacterium sp.]|jgi:cell division protein FtsN